MMNARQRSLIWCLLAEKFNLRDSNTAEKNKRYEMMQRVVGKRSMSKFTSADAVVFIKFLNGETPPETAYKEPPLPKAMTPPRMSDDPPSAEQMNVITQLFENMGAHGLVRTAFFRHQLKGNPWPATVAEAQAVTEALKAMYARGHRFTPQTKDEHKPATHRRRFSK